MCLNNIRLKELKMDITYIRRNGDANYACSGLIMCATRTSSSVLYPGEVTSTKVASFVRLILCSDAPPSKQQQIEPRGKEMRCTHENMSVRMGSDYNTKEPSGAFPSPTCCSLHDGGLYVFGYKPVIPRHEQHTSSCVSGGIGSSHRGLCEV